MSCRITTWGKLNIEHKTIQTPKKKIKIMADVKIGSITGII
jgi:hypothetical protein